MQPAEECKRIHVGDTLVRVDGIDVEGKEETAVETLISGVYGSPVSLTVESGHDRERRSVKLLRKEVVVGRFILKIQVCHGVTHNACLLPRVHTSLHNTPSYSCAWFPHARSPPQVDESAAAAEASGAAERDSLVPAPQEPTPARARRPDDQDQASPTLSPEARMDTFSKTAMEEATVPLAKFLELERRVHELEAQMTQQVQAPARKHMERRRIKTEREETHTRHIEWRLK